MLVQDLFSLEGKVAVVVGGGGVLAGGMAQGFAGAGAQVAVVDLNEEAAKTRAAAICAERGKAIAIKADVTKKADLENALRVTLNNFGQVDILLNAAGINSATPFFEIEENEWERIMDVNLRSVFLAARSSARPWSRRGRAVPSSTSRRYPPARRCRRCSLTV